MKVGASPPLAQADHSSAAPYLKQKLGGKVAIGARINTVQETFKMIFNAEEGFAMDGRQFDRHFEMALPRLLRVR